MENVISFTQFWYLTKRTTNSTGIRANCMNCLLYKVLLNLHIFLMLNKRCTELCLVRYIEAISQFYGNYSTLDFHTNIVIFHAFAYSSRWRRKPWQVLYHRLGVHLMVSNFHNRHAILLKRRFFFKNALTSIKQQLKHEIRSCLKILLFKKKKTKH